MRGFIWIVPSLLMCQFAAVRFVTHAENPPDLPHLPSLPDRLGTWTAAAEDPIGDGVREVLGADLLLSRIYTTPAPPAQANLLVAWFRTQSRGLRQPHSPQVCLPGSGWTPILSDRVVFDGHEVNRYVASSGGRQAVVLYWYQTARRVTAGEWASKFFTIWDAITERRTDIALVRIVTWPHTGVGARLATQQSLSFAGAAQPYVAASLFGEAPRP